MMNEETNRDETPNPKMIFWYSPSPKYSTILLQHRAYVLLQLPLFGRIHERDGFIAA